MKITSYSRHDARHSGTNIEHEIDKALSHLELLYDILINIKDMLAQSANDSARLTNNTSIE